MKKIKVTEVKKGDIFYASENPDSTDYTILAICVDDEKNNRYSFEFQISWLNRPDSNLDFAKSEYVLLLDENEKALLNLTT
jgi:hypothetical protein